MQRTHYNSVFKKRQNPIVIVCDNIQDGRNLGGILRAADAFGVKHIYICGNRTELDKNVRRTSRSSENSVSFSFESSTLEILKSLKSDGHKIIALEITESSKDLMTFGIPREDEIALVIGSENFGISEDALKIADSHYHINMFGQNSSMNVVQATSIALYELSRHFL